MKGRRSARKRPAFGARLAAARVARGFTQQSLAKTLRIKRTLLKYYERETADPKVSVVLKCARALEVPPETLLGTEHEGFADMDSAVQKVARLLMTLKPKRRGFALRLIKRQLAEFKKPDSHL